MLDRAVARGRREPLRVDRAVNRKFVFRYVGDLVGVVTALSAGLALIPLALARREPGNEI
jgi:hypothetical protein